MKVLPIESSNNKVNEDKKDEEVPSDLSSILKYMKVKLVYEGPIQAPIKQNDKVGNLKIYYKDEIIGDYDLLASENIKKQNIISRIISSINFLLWGDV